MLVKIKKYFVADNLKMETSYVRKQLMLHWSQTLFMSTLHVDLVKSRMIHSENCYEDGKQPCCMFMQAALQHLSNMKQGKDVDVDHTSRSERHRHFGFSNQRHGFAADRRVSLVLVLMCCWLFPTSFTIYMNGYFVIICTFYNGLLLLLSI